MAPGVQLRLESAVAEIRFSADDTRNALTPALVDEMAAALATAEADPACRVIVIAAGGETFCSGMAMDADVGYSGDRIAVIRTFAGCLTQIVRSTRPVVARVEGNATGGGVGLLAACDVVLASTHARFVLPELIMGLIPAIVAPFLLRRMSVGRLRALALSTRALTAAEAQTLGLVDEVADAMDSALEQQLQRLLRCSPAAIAATKRYFCAIGEPDLEARVQQAIDELEAWLARGEAEEGFRQFTSGFAPAWFQTYRRPHG